MKKTKHARVRMRQRAINEVLVEIVMAHGDQVHDKNGDVFHCLPNRKRRHSLAHDLRKAADKLEARDGIFAVESSDGRLITVGHQYRRHRPHKSTGIG